MPTRSHARASRDRRLYPEIDTAELIAGYDRCAQTDEAVPVSRAVRGRLTAPGSLLYRTQASRRAPRPLECDRNNNPEQNECISCKSANR